MVLDSTNRLALISAWSKVEYTISNINLYMLYILTTSLSLSHRNMVAALLGRGQHSTEHSGRVLCGEIYVSGRGSHS